MPDRRHNQSIRNRPPGQQTSNDITRPASRSRLARKLVFSALTVLLFFALIEAILRLTGVGAPPILGTLRFGYDTGIPKFDSDGIEQEGQVFADYPLFQADPVLFWKPIASTVFTGTEGLRLPVPPQPQKSSDVYRVAVLGDSCSFLGRQLYPQRFADLAAPQLGKRVEIVNASCPGYTSFQGVRRAADVWRWQPDMLIVYFGWNDHWNALNGYSDEQLRSLSALQPTYELARHFRTYWALERLLHRDPAALPAHPGRTVRVPLDDYQKNLQQLATAAGSHKCRVVFVTAPTAFVPQGPPDWAYPFFKQFYDMSADEVRAIPNTHEQYNQVVRRVARESNALLLDLAAAWPSDQSPGRFRSDCIHLTEQGHADAAAALCKLLMEDRQNAAPLSPSPRQ